MKVTRKQPRSKVLVHARAATDPQGTPTSTTWHARLHSPVVTLAMVYSLWALAGVAHAETMVYTQVSEFLTHVKPGYFFEDFSSVEHGHAPPEGLDFGPADGFGFNVNTPPGSVSGLFNDVGLISTFVSGDALQVSFFQEVTAVGGNFWTTDIDFFPTTARIDIALSDGTYHTYLATGPGDFRGFVTSGPPITSLLVFNGTAVAAWPTLDNLYVGAIVPEPPRAVLLDIGFLSLIGLWLRRTWMPGAQPPCPNRAQGCWRLGLRDC